MKTRDFCYWLQGFFEISGTKLETLTEEQVKMIKSHLKLVFRHEIDPSMGDQAHQETLSALHEGKLDLGDFLNQNPHLNPHGNTFPFIPNGMVERC